MIRALRFVGAAAVAAVSLTGCVRLTADTTIGDDDTFSHHSVIAVSDSVATQLASQGGVDLGGLVSQAADSDEYAEFQARYPDQVTIEDYDSGELHGVEITATDIPLEELDTVTRQASAIGVDIDLSLEDDTWLLEVVPGAALNPRSFGLTDANIALAEAAVDIGMTFTFPGLIREASVGQVEGNTITLHLSDLTSGLPIHITADNSESTDWGPFLKWGGIALAFIVVIGGATALVLQDRRKSRRNSLPAPTTTEGAAAGPGMIASATDEEESSPRDS